VVRAFGGDAVTQVEGHTVNPLRDLDILMAELLQIDRQTASRECRPLQAQVDSKLGGTALAADCAALEKASAWRLQRGRGDCNAPPPLPPSSSSSRAHFLQLA
jgi:ribosome-binding ATPase YchF (GTP1/OBG family)